MPSEVLFGKDDMVFSNDKQQYNKERYVTWNMLGIDNFPTIDCFFRSISNYSSNRLDVIPITRTTWCKTFQFQLHSRTSSLTHSLTGCPYTFIFWQTSIRLVKRGKLREKLLALIIKYKELFLTWNLQIIKSSKRVCTLSQYTLHSGSWCRDLSSCDYHL